jgi:hypothetical protein
MRLAVVLFSCIGLLLGAGASLADKHKEPPPKGESCSPGYWKNHPEDWVGICCDVGEALSCQAVDELLRAKGPGSSAMREAGANYLEACVGQPCNED